MRAPENSAADLQHLKKVFVVGVGRSGTSLVHSILAAHIRTVSAPETAFVRRYVVPALFKEKSGRLGFDTVRAVLEDDPLLERLTVDGKSPLPPADGSAISMAQIYDRIVQGLQQRSQPGACIFVDKDPRLVEYLPTISQIWHDALVVHVIRDPRDVLASKKLAAWSRNRSVLWHVFAGRVQFTMGEKFGKRALGSRYLEIVYEELLASPESVLRKVCIFIGIDFDPGMLSFSGAAKALVTAEEVSWKSATLGPLLTANHGKWVAELGPWEIALCEIASEPMMRHGHYLYSNEKWRRVLLWVAEPMFALASTLYCRFLLRSQPR